MEFCRSKGVKFYASNKNYPEEVFDDSISRKIKADMYIDDINYGGLVNLGELYSGIMGDSPHGAKSKKKKWFC